MIRPIAIHLPQFHPIPENDLWWGKGFTEWTNVVKAKPLFKGHYQPHVPGALGYYDLREEQARIMQAELAKQYGIYGFCYYHYWFNGKRLLNKPLDDMLSTQTPDFPFMLCWANENWTRRWDGEDHEVLIKQEYSEEDHYAHAHFICNYFFRDKRYITIDGKPVYIFYKPSLVPYLKKAVEIWRAVALQEGLPGIFLLCMDNFIDRPAETYGFDGAVHFHPDYRYFQSAKLSLANKLLYRLIGKKNIHEVHHVEEYKSYNENVLSKNLLKSKLVFPGIMPSWDNTPRKQRNGIIFKKSTPALYGRFLQEQLKRFKPKGEKNLFFINAWNEWAEGNHLEPCQKWGLAYLQQTKEGIAAYQ